MTRAQTKHPLDPLSATEISVAVATVRAAGATPEVKIALHYYDFHAVIVSCYFITVVILVFHHLVPFFRLEIA